jgi:uncharacterized protein (TIGR03437 family)
VLNRILGGIVFIPFALGVSLAQTPAILPGGTVNAASNGAGQPVAPGGLVSIYGSSFAAGLALASSVPLSTNLSGTSVTINNVPAALDFVSPGQINAQVPFNVLPTGVTSGSVNVVVTNNGVPSAPSPVVISPAGPAVFEYNTPTTPSVSYGLAYFALGPNTGSYAWPPNTAPPLNTFLAVPGDLLTVLATGLGAVTPAEANGSAPVYDPGTYQNRSPVATPQVFIGNVPAQVQFAGLSPQFPGVFQLNVYVPQVPAGNAVPFQIQVGTAMSPPVYIGVGAP